MGGAKGRRSLAAGRPRVITLEGNERLLDDRLTDVAPAWAPTLQRWRPPTTLTWRSTTSTVVRYRCGSTVARHLERASEDMKRAFSRPPIRM